MGKVALEDALKTAEMIIKAYSGPAQMGPDVSRKAAAILAKSLDIIADEIGVGVTQ